MQPDLIPAGSVPATLSRMEAWRQRYGVILYPTMDGFRAISQLRKAHGKTREAALLAWADKAGKKCWKAEELDEIEAARILTEGRAA